MSDLPHTEASYYNRGGLRDMAARPQNIGQTPPHAMTSGITPRVAVTVTTSEPDHSMLPGEAYEEMPVRELRVIAAARGIKWRDANKATLIARLRA